MRFDDFYYYFFYIFSLKILFFLRHGWLVRIFFRRVERKIAKKENEEKWRRETFIFNPFFEFLNHYYKWFLNMHYIIFFYSYCIQNTYFCSLQGSSDNKISDYSRTFSPSVPHDLHLRTYALSSVYFLICRHSAEISGFIWDQVTASLLITSARFSVCYATSSIMWFYLRSSDSKIFS